MAILSVPNSGLELQDPAAIRSFLNNIGVYFDQWHCDIEFSDDATQEDILAAYAKDLDPFMQQGGYHTADVISIHSGTPNYEAIRAKFLAEHIHTEDEIRFLSMVKVCFGLILKVTKYSMYFVNAAISSVYQWALNIGLMPEQKIRLSRPFAFLQICRVGHHTIQKQAPSKLS